MNQKEEEEDNIHSDCVCPCNANDDRKKLYIKLSKHQHKEAAFNLPIQTLNKFRN